jgi:xylose isomerase
MDGVWASAAGCMRNYLILREKSRAFRADPEVQAALVAARLDQLALPTLSAGESLADLRAENFDPEEAGARGMAFEHLDQLALEHLYGVRG